MTLSQSNSSDYFGEEDSAFLEALRDVVLPGDRPEDLGGGHDDVGGDPDDTEELEPPPSTQPGMKRKRSLSPELRSVSPEQALQEKIQKPAAKVYDDSGDVYGAAHFGEFGEYMQRKRAKLQIQNAEIAEAGSQSKIFEGLSIYVNGWTQPSVQELRRLIVQHGGIFQPYLDKKSLVTHIVTSSLTPAKLREWKHLKVVRPEWLVDSIQAAQLLNWRDYIYVPQEGLEPSQGTTGRQKRLFPVGSFKPPTFTSDATSKNNETSNRNNSSSKPVPPKSSIPASKTAPSKISHPQAVNPPPNATAGPPPPEMTSTPKKPPLPPQPPAATTDPIKPHVPYAALDSNPHAQRAMANPEWRKAHTSVAPDFIEGYYKNSRLHHLAMWKSELKSLVAEAQERAESGAGSGSGGGNGGGAGVGRGGSGTGGVENGGVSMRGAELLLKSSTPAGGGGAANVKGKAKAAEEYPKERVIMHCDFDCFFVSAGLVSRPSLKGKPVVVCHSQGGVGGQESTSEIASASYEARAFGIKNGMSLQQARKLCPEVQTIPYEFEKYKEFSLKFYTILMRHADDLQAVSVDEALLDVSNAVRQLKASNPTKAKQDPAWDPARELAETIRDEVRAATSCEVSIGISHNILLSRLATRLAKPSKSYHLLPSQVPSFLAPLDITDLHGFGYALKQKAEEKLGTSVLGELKGKSKGALCEALGKVSGERLWNAVRGVDERELEGDKKRKSVSCEINYGIRFESNEQAEMFVYQMATEVVRRMKEVNVVGRHITLKIMKRDPSAPVEPPKFLGHGPCENFTKQSSLLGPGGRATNDAKVIGEHASRLLKSFGFDPKELRGIGIQIQKLEPVNAHYPKGPTGSGGTLAGGGQAALPFRRIDVPSDKNVLVKGAATASGSGQGQGKKQVAFAISEPPKVLQPPIQDDDEVVVLSQAPKSFQERGERAGSVNSSRAASNNPSEYADLPSFSQVDKSVFDALPPDIRQELEQEYKRRSASPAPIVINKRQKSPAKMAAPPVANTTRQRASGPLTTRGGKLFVPGFVPKTSRPLFPTNNANAVNVRRITGQLAPRNRPGNYIFQHKPHIFTAPKEHSFTTSTSTSRLAKSLLSLASIVNPKTRKRTVVLSPSKVEELGFDPDVFFQLPENIQREQLVRVRLQKKNGGVSPSPPNSQRLVLQPARPVWPPGWKPYRAPPPYANFKPVIVIRKQQGEEKLVFSETADVQDLIEGWVTRCERWKRKPQPKDVEVFAKWVVRAVDRERATDADAEKAVSVMKWWRVLLKRYWGAAEIFDDELDGSQVDELGRAWWTAFGEVKDKMDEVARKKFGGCLSLR
ncbi:hypothetical protein AX16_004499 [Volvariella volvacea WC 439]|nr:hypothetical protein AX16_004499 [Volvariella volvacea WC 439]